MKKLYMLFAVCCLIFAPLAHAALRVSTDAMRTSDATVRGGSARTATPARTATHRTQPIVARTAARATSARSATAHPVATVARTAARATPARAATPHISAARSAAPNVARATAVFSDISKMGTGYTQCRDAYNTCMDQFCANSNDTYRRCWCSGRLDEFRDDEAMLGEVKFLLQKFEDNNLDAVDKTAGEVTSMYTATVGERAIRNDTSGAASALSEISDLLSGKQKADSGRDELWASFTGFSADINDIFAGSNDDIFGSNTPSLTELEGADLYSAAHGQCMEVIGNSCTNDALAQMARSSYSILITQDCNLYQKSIDAQKEAVTQTTRTANKYLRDARLEEYRSHNSADVNQCITAVKTAITNDLACGENYKKCLDYTGLYINTNSGDPIYSPRLFQLETIMTLNDTGDVIAANPQFNKFLDDKLPFVQTALDTCRDIGLTVVWPEFKRQALIEIAQAQDEKIEEVKMTCVSTMKECYDTQTNGMKSMDNTSSQSSGAISAYAARAMCADRVAACAALYAGPGDVECTFDSNGRLQNTQCVSALLAFVNLVDDVKVAEGCETALVNYTNETCTPTTGGQKYPYNCRLTTPGEFHDMLMERANVYCIDPTTRALNEAVVGPAIARIESEVFASMDSVLDDACAEYDGVWFASDAAELKNAMFAPNQQFMSSVMGGRDIAGWGMCAQYTAAMQCTNDGVTCNSNGSVDLDEQWYKTTCETMMNGGWDTGAKVCWYKP